MSSLESVLEHLSYFLELIVTDCLIDTKQVINSCAITIVAFRHSSTSHQLEVHVWLTCGYYLVNDPTWVADPTYKYIRSRIAIKSMVEYASQSVRPTKNIKIDQII